MEPQVLADRRDGGDDEPGKDDHELGVKKCRLLSLVLKLVNAYI